MINNKLIMNEMRKRIVACLSIEATNQIQTENNAIDVEGVAYWIKETCIGGNAYSISPKRERINTFLIQYDFYTKNGTGNGLVVDKINLVKSEFDLKDNTKSVVNVNGYNINIRSIKQELNEDKNYYRATLLFTLDVIS